MQAFSHHNDQKLDDDIQQMVEKQGLYLRGLYQKNYISRINTSILSLMTGETKALHIQIHPMICTIVWNVRGINTQGVMEMT